MMAVCKVRTLQEARNEMRMAFTFMPSLGASSEQAGSCWEKNDRNIQKQQSNSNIMIRDGCELKYNPRI